MEQNHEHARTNNDLDRSYGIVRAENNQLQSKIEKLRDQEDSFRLEKTYAFYQIRRKILEEAIEGIANIDNCIAKARKLETTALDNIPARPTASSSLNISSEYSVTKEESKEEEKDIDEGLGPDAKQPSSTKEVEETSLPSDSASKNNRCIYFIFSL